MHLPPQLFACLPRALTLIHETEYRSSAEHEMKSVAEIWETRIELNSEQSLFLCARVQAHTRQTSVSQPGKRPRYAPRACNQPLQPAAAAPLLPPAPPRSATGGLLRLARGASSLLTSLPAALLLLLPFWPLPQRCVRVAPAAIAIHTCEEGCQRWVPRLQLFSRVDAAGHVCMRKKRAPTLRARHLPCSMRQHKQCTA